MVSLLKKPYRTGFAQSRIRLLWKNMKEEVNEAEQFGRKRTSHARSEAAAKKLGQYVNPQHKQTRNRTRQSRNYWIFQDMI
jgi:hypothetical protein